MHCYRCSLAVLSLAEVLLFSDVLCRPCIEPAINFKAVAYPYFIETKVHSCKLQQVIIMGLLLFRSLRFGLSVENKVMLGKFTLRHPSLLQIRILTASATSNEGMGPTNHLLVEISAYSFSPLKLSTINEVFQKRLNKLRDYKRYRNSLIKTLSLVLYLFQNGSDGVVAWVRSNRYQFEGLTNVPDSTIPAKAEKILQLCDDAEKLKTYRLDIHRYRSDMGTPGLKRTSIEADDVSTVVEDLRFGVKSLDLPRQGKLLVANLDTLVEEAY